jgi:hypothetical protein
MEASTRTTVRSAWLQDCNSMLISALCNLSVLVALGLMTGAASNKWGGLKLIADAGDSDAPLLDDAPLADTVKLDVSPDTGAALGPVKLFDDVAMPTSNGGSLDMLSQKASPLAGFEGLALGGSAKGDGTSGPASTEFFGIGGYGQTFVYVVDASGSMNDEGKFDRARYELMHSIEQLDSDQRYFVIFYNHAAYPMGADEPVFASEEEVAKTANWVMSTSANGGTNPLPALLHALSMRPDAIYFLSDGQFHPMAIPVLRAQNRPTKRVKARQIPIHTIAFVDHATVGLMRTIARDSNGEHRFVK